MNWNIFLLRKLHCRCAGDGRIFPYDTFKRDDIAGEFLQPGYPRDARERSGVKDRGAGDQSLVREGYKVYDANGALLRTCEDEVIDQAAWNETIRSFADGSVYALKQEGENYIFEIDAPDEEEYVLAVSGTHNTASWDRFLNK